MTSVMAGRSVRINFATGEVKSGPYKDESAALRARIEELESEVKRWRWNANHWEQEAENIRRNMVRHHAERATVLARVGRLVNVRRKTVRMDDLRAALYKNE